jgi:NMD protein affecting ribosome stability and mRNA decay
MTVTEEFNSSIHECKVEFNEKIFCPNCGKQHVYTELGFGDFYEGLTNFCKSCKCEFTMPTFEVNKNIEFSND